MNVIMNLVNHKVDFKGTVLKPNMVIPGSEASEKIKPEEIAKKTLDCLKKMCLVKFLVLLFIWWTI